MRIDNRDNMRTASVTSLAFILLIYVVEGVNDGCGKYTQHNLREGRRCCQPITCPSGYIPVICTGNPESTDCKPCNGTKYFMDRPNESVDGKTCKLKSILKCTLKKGQIHEYFPGVDPLDNTRDTGRCVCSAKHNYIPHPDYTDMCLFCGNGSGQYVDDYGKCGPCDGKVVYHPVTYHVSCITAVDATSTPASHHTDRMVPARDVNNPKSPNHDDDEHIAPNGDTLGYKVSTAEPTETQITTSAPEVSDKIITIISVCGSFVLVVVVVSIGYCMFHKKEVTSMNVSTDGSSISSQPKTGEEIEPLHLERRVGDEDEVGSFQTLNEEQERLYVSENEAMTPSTEDIATRPGAMTTSPMENTPVENIVSSEENKDDTVVDMSSERMNPAVRSTEPGHQPAKSQATADRSDYIHIETTYVDPAVSTVVDIDPPESYEPHPHDSQSWPPSGAVAGGNTNIEASASAAYEASLSQTATPLVHGRNSFPGYTNATSTGHPSENNTVRTPPGVHREQSRVQEPPRHSTHNHGISTSSNDEELSLHSEATLHAITDDPTISLDGPPCDHGIPHPSCSTSSSFDGPRNGSTPDGMHTGDIQDERHAIRDDIHLEHGDNMEDISTEQSASTQVKQPNGTPSTTDNSTKHIPHPPSTSDVSRPPTNVSLPNGVPPNQHVGDLHLQNGGISGNAIVGANVNSGGSINVNINHNYYGLNDSGDTKATPHDSRRNTDR